MIQFVWCLLDWNRKTIMIYQKFGGLKGVPQNKLTTEFIHELHLCPNSRLKQSTNVSFNVKPHQHFWSHRPPNFLVRKPPCHNNRAFATSSIEMWFVLQIQRRPYARVVRFFHTKSRLRYGQLFNETKPNQTVHTGFERFSRPQRRRGADSANSRRFVTN